MLLLLDNFDSYTYNLYDYLSQIGFEVHVVRNDTALSEITRYNYSGIVFSPGPSRPQDAGVMIQVLEYYYEKLPILGVCLGHQAIGEFFGAQLVKHRPHHGKISLLTTKPDPIFENTGEPVQVVRYHSLVLENLPDCLESIAESEDGKIMALRHKTLPIYGLQFHPEAILTKDGLQILKNWRNRIMQQSVKP
jgi:anthranilate synthase component 2